jgi:hypothetical protein
MSRSVNWEEIGSLARAVAPELTATHCRALAHVGGAREACGDDWEPHPLTLAALVRLGYLQDDEATPTLEGRVVLAAMHRGGR